MIGARIAAATLLAGILSAPVFATTSTETEFFGPGTPNFTSTLNFDKFDPSLGSLNSIKIEMSVAVAGGSLTIDNDGEGPATVNVELGAKGELSSGDVNLFPGLVPPVVSSSGSGYVLNPDNGDGPFNIDPTGPDGAVMLGAAGWNLGWYFVTPLAHPDYVGASQTFNIDAVVSQILDFGGVGGVEGSFSPVDANGYVSVTYDYTSNIPEPASIGLLGSCLLAFAMFRRSSR
ncbi:MAG: PEP-CTERM sorting domain-containing protein [Pirellulales bacterium]|nr:PEP-CTERM sorting domain-containing protein [Pirellulales bacterium]